MFAIILPALGFAKTWWKAAVGFIVGAAMCFPLAYCEGKKAGRAQMETAIQKANVEALKQKARADEISATQRITDTIAVNRQEERLRDAIATTPDEAPDAVRIRLGCERLRANGQRAADLPRVCGTGSGAQARPAR